VRIVVSEYVVDTSVHAVGFGPTPGRYAESESVISMVPCERLSRHICTGIALTKTDIGCPVLIISILTVFGLVSGMYHCG